MGYLELIKKFPLRSIRTADQHSQAVNVLIDLTRNGERLSSDELDYVSALADLIGLYETAALEAKSTSDPRRALRYLLTINGLHAVDLAHIVPESHTSAFLGGMGAPGERKLSKTEAAKLGAFFKVDPMLFLDRVVPITSATGLKKRKTKRKPSPAPSATEPKLVIGRVAGVRAAYITERRSPSRQTARKAVAAKPAKKAVPAKPAKKREEARKGNKGLRGR